MLLQKVLDVLDSQIEGVCGAALGPLSELTRACDESMDFLLGKEMSTGTLASIAKSVFGKKYIVTQLYNISSPASHSSSWHPLLFNRHRGTR